MRNQRLDEDEKFALMSLIVASYDELLMEGEDQTGHWSRIRRHLLDRFDLHGYTVQYWAFPDDDDASATQDGFDFTPLAREVMEVVYGPRDRWPRRPFAAKRFIDWPDPVQPGVPLDSMEISDNRDGSFSLCWSKYRDRPFGEKTFPSIVEAMEYAATVFGIAPERWTDTSSVGTN